MVGLNPGYLAINNSLEEIEARRSWEDYLNFYQYKFFKFFDAKATIVVLIWSIFLIGGAASNSVVFAQSSSEKKEPVLVCPQGSQLTGSLGSEKCVAEPTCPQGSTLNTQTGQCETTTAVAACPHGT